MEYCCERDYEMNYVGNYGRGSRLHPRAPHMIGIKTKQTIIQTIKKQTIMKKLSVKAGNDLQIQHSSMNASAVEAMVNKSKDIKLTFTDDTYISAVKRTIPASMTNPNAQDVVVVNAVGVLVEEDTQPKTINITRILGQLTTGSTVSECADDLSTQLDEASSNTLLVDIETLSNFNGAKRFSNVRIAK